MKQKSCKLWVRDLTRQGKKYFPPQPGMYSQGEKDPAQAAGQRVRQLLLRSGIQPSLRVIVKTGGSEILWKEFGKS